jgi:TPR repeat protein
VKQDAGRAAYWYKKSLSALARGSHLGLAMAYECGVPRNLEKAIELYKKTPNYFK